jgi:hypothetical protein
MMFYVWPLAISALRFILVVGAQTLLVPVLTFAVQGFWLQVGSRTNMLYARVNSNRSRDRAVAHQADFGQVKYAHDEIGNDRPILETR